MIIFPDQLAVHILQNKCTVNKFRENLLPGRRTYYGVKLTISAAVMMKACIQALKTGIFFSLLETDSNSPIEIAESPLIDYRTSPASSNVKSMEKRLTIMRYMIEKHKSSYSGHLTDALLGIEAISDARPGFCEDEIINTLKSGNEISDAAKAFIRSPSYGDGGMAAAINITGA